MKTIPCLGAQAPECAVLTRGFNISALCPKLLCLTTLLSGCAVHQDNANGHQIVLKLLDANEKAATGLAIFVGALSRGLLLVLCWFCVLGKDKDYKSSDSAGDAESKALQEELFKKMQMQVGQRL